MKTYTDIFEYCTVQETAMSQPIEVIDGYDFNLKEHIRSTVLYKNSQLESGKNKGMSNEKPVKNITLPILRLQYRTEGFDVKDIELFVDDAKNYYKSFLVKKFHTKWARENRMDTFIDQLVESYVDFGGVLVKKTKGAIPEVVPMQSIAFCDQTNLLSGPIGIKHYFAPHELKEMEKFGWGLESNGATIAIDDLILLSEDKKSDKLESRENKTPGAYIELYEITGSLCDNFIPDGDPYDYSLQKHIIGYYTDSSGLKQGVSLFSKRVPDLNLKVLLRDEIYGRALGLGGAEELFEAQIWTNYDEIRIKEMLDEAAKIVYKTTDHLFAERNNIEEMKTGKILSLEPNTDISQLDNFPRNLSVFANNVDKWMLHAQQLGNAQDPIQGGEAKSGTPFRAQALSVTQAQGVHEYRKGKIATFLDEIYMDWIMPYIVSEINKGQEFLAELDLNELTEVRDQITENQANRMALNKILNGELVTPEEVEEFKIKASDEFSKGGSKRFLKILKNEMKDAPVSVRISIAGKQKDMSLFTDKLSSVFGQILANPGILQDPMMSQLFSEILESSGLDSIRYASLAKKALPAPVAPQLANQLAPQPTIKSPVLTQ